MKKPINTMLANYASSHPIRLHMPGHKGTTYANDITELPFSDTLHKPTGVIAQSQDLYAKEVGAKQCHYLVNGSTSGVLAMMMCSKGKVLVDSASHSSIKNSAKLLGKELVVVNNSFIDEIPMPLTLAEVKNALESDSEIGTIMLTSPNYYGFTSDVKAIYKLARSSGKLLFIDSAHGAHFGLNKLLPTNAVKYCSACVQSTHKTLGGLTQTAVLLVGDNKLNASLKEAINMTMTTSPSYLLMASIEQCYSYALDNSEKYNALQHEVELFKRKVQQIGFSVVATDDFTRLVIDCQPMNARVVYNSLCKQGVYCEFADERYLICILTLYDNGLTLDCLYTALSQVDSKCVKYDNSYVANCINKE